MLQDARRTGLDAFVPSSGTWVGANVEDRVHRCFPQDAATDTSSPGHVRPIARTRRRGRRSTTVYVFTHGRGRLVPVGQRRNRNRLPSKTIYLYVDLGVKTEDE